MTARTAAQIDAARKVSPDRECLEQVDFDNGWGGDYELFCDLRYPHWLHHAYVRIPGVTPDQELWWATVLPPGAERP